MSDKPQSKGAGGKLHHAYESADLLEQAYADSSGEITEETEALEQVAALANADALRAFAGFAQHCVHGLEAIKIERERLDAAEKRINKAAAWAEAQTLGLLGERKKATAGTFKISTRLGSERVEVAAAFVAGDGVPACVWKDPPPVAEGRWVLDKAAAKALIKAGTTIQDVSVVRGPTRIKIA